MYSLVFKSVEHIDINLFIVLFGLKGETPVRFVPFAINSYQPNV